MDTQLAKTIKSLAPQKEDHELTELINLSHKVSQKVGNFLDRNNLAHNKSGLTVPNDSVDLESIDSDLAEEGSNGIGQLLEEAQIPEEYHDTAAQQVALQFYKHFNSTGGGSGVFGSHLVRAEQESASRRSLDTVFSSEVAGQLGTSLESFGANIDQTSVDIKLAITVALMRFHMGITPRMLPTRVTSSPAVQYKVPRVSVFDLSDPDTEGTPMLNLFSDPQLVSNNLPEIKPLESNDTNDVLVADSRLRFGHDVPMLDLSIDSTKTGYSKINHTDTVADGVRFDKVRVEVTANDGTDDTSDTFDLIIPSDRNRLTRLNDSPDAADRALLLKHAFFLGHSTENTSGSTSSLLTNADQVDGEDIEGIKITLDASVKINLKSGVCRANASGDAETHQVNGEDLSTDFSNDTSGGVTITLVNYEMDAKFSEENLRKTSIAVRQDARTMEYEIPLGRHYVADTALSQEMSDELPANLTRILQLGEDHVTLNLVRDALDNVSDRIAEAEQQSLGNIDVGKNYAAGCMVKPTVYNGTLSVHDLLMVGDNDRSGAIKERTLRYLNSVTTRLQSGSYLREQIAAGSNIRFRVATTVKILGSILGLDHTYPNLDRGSEVNDESGVEYRVQLSNGSILEVVTTNFQSMEDTMILVPYIEDSPESVLNFGTIWDMGAIVGRTSYGSIEGGAHNRLFGHARQQFVPTNPVGAIINVVGAYEANEDSYGSTPS